MNQIPSLQLVVEVILPKLHRCHAMPKGRLVTGEVTIMATTLRMMTTVITARIYPRYVPGHCTEHFTRINSFNPHYAPVR